VSSPSVASTAPGSEGVGSLALGQAEVAAVAGGEAPPRRDGLDGASSAGWMWWTHLPLDRVGGSPGPLSLERVQVGRWKSIRACVRV
jgi:hypothetical protein